MLDQQLRQESSPKPKTAAYGKRIQGLNQEWFGRRVTSLIRSKVTSVAGQKAATCTAQTTHMLVINCKLSSIVSWQQPDPVCAMIFQLLDSKCYAAGEQPANTCDQSSLQRRRWTRLSRNSNQSSTQNATADKGSQAKATQERKGESPACARPLTLDKGAA